MSARGGIVSAGLLLAVAGSIGCRSGPPPGDLYARAERLRLRYEKTASEEAIRTFEAAADGWRLRGDLRQAARARQRAGLTYVQLGLLHDALQAYRAALAVVREAAEPRLESDVLSDVGTVQGLVAARERDSDQAQRHCEDALAIARREVAPPLEAKALVCLAEAAYNRGERMRALELYDQAERLAERAGDRRAAAEALVARCSVHSDQGQYTRAGSCFAQSSAAWQALDDARGLAVASVGLAKLQERRGEYDDALGSLLASLEAFRRMGDVWWEGVSLSAIGSVHLRTGDADGAIDYWERALDRFQAAALSSFQPDLLRSLGEAYLAAGDDRRALDRFERALTLGEELGNDHWQAYALWNIGVVHLVRGDGRKAVDLFERSLATQARLRDPRTESQTRASLGAAWILQGEYARARAAFDEAVRLSRSVEDRLGEAMGLDGLARVSMAAGDLDAAREHVQRALDVAESLRAELGSRDVRASYLASVHRYYQTHVDVLMRLHKTSPSQGFAAAAFEASERARARSLLDGLAEAGVDLRRGLDPALLQREQALRQEFDAWAVRQRQALDAGTFSTLTVHLAGEYRDLEARHGNLEAAIRRKNPRYAALVRPRPLTLRQVQQHLLDADTLLLEYALGEQRSYLWAVTAGGFSVHELPSRTELERAARDLYTRLTARHTQKGTMQERQRQAEESDRRYWEHARQLSGVLLGPVVADMAGKRIVVVADGALQFLPFAALPMPGGSEPVPLIAEHEVVNVPSASVLEFLRREADGRAVPAGTVAVLADPVFEQDDPRVRAAIRASGTAGAQPPPGRPERGTTFRLARLPATRLEADAVIAAAGSGKSATWLGFDASRRTAMGPELSRFRVVHVAAHGVFDDDNPGMSGIMLSMFDAQGRAQDGFLRLHDIYELDLPADLVVLSACSTALGRQLNGEGLVGSVRGFMYAGAKRVIASLWKVDDDVTGELMRRFYDGMFKGRLSPAAALRAAQLAVWSQPRWKAPFFWAAFSLQGEWKP
jgi:CHAT domain-containing protein/tetratricopeptide (TPR) repeat protein